MNRGVAGATLAAAIVTLGACGTTAYDTGRTTTAAGDTTTVPTGTAQQLLERLRTRAFDLGNAIVASDGEDREVLDELDGLWAAAIAQLPRTDFVLGVEHQLQLMHNAVERHRPADADKAARAINALVAAQLAS